MYLTVKKRSHNRIQGFRKNFAHWILKEVFLEFHVFSIFLECLLDIVPSSYTVLHICLLSSFSLERSHLAHDIGNVWTHTSTPLVKWRPERLSLHGTAPTQWDQRVVCHSCCQLYTVHQHSYEALEFGIIIKGPGVLLTVTIVLMANFYWHCSSTIYIDFGIM